MVELPKVELSEQAKMELLYAWYIKKQELTTLQASEMALRKTVVEAFAPNPKEGTTTIKLPTGDELKIVGSVNRKIDKAIFSSILPQCMENGIDVNEITETEVKLKVGEYKKLDATLRSIFDECVTATVGSPQVSIKVKG